MPEDDRYHQSTRWSAIGASCATPRVPTTRQARARACRSGMCDPVAYDETADTRVRFARRMDARIPSPRAAASSGSKARHHVAGVALFPSREPFVCPDENQDPDGASCE
jgi:hypothetical protein